MLRKRFSVAREVKKVGCFRVLATTIRKLCASRPLCIDATTILLKYGGADETNVNQRAVSITRAMHYWLIKSEPSTFSIADLGATRGQTDHWDGVRNYQARNFMRDQMKLNDQAFFYHSNCAQPGIVGVVEIAREAYPDFTAFDAESPYYDPKSSADNPRWYMVDVRLVRSLNHLIPLDQIKANPALQDMPLMRRGNRLSVMPVTTAQWKAILRMEP